VAQHGGVAEGKPWVNSKFEIRSPKDLARDTRDFWDEESNPDSEFEFLISNFEFS
jgi:hypothetical protein